MTMDDERLKAIIKQIAGTYDMSIECVEKTLDTLQLRDPTKTTLIKREWLQHEIQEQEKRLYWVYRYRFKKQEPDNE